MRECILGQQWHVFESWRVSEGAGVGTSLCSLCWVESHQMKRGLILFRLFWHMHSNKLTRHFSPGKSCVLMRFHPGLVSTGWYLSQFMSVCLCLCVSESGQYCFCTLLEVLLTVDLLLTSRGASYCHRNLRPPGCIWKLEVLAFLSPLIHSRSKTFNGFL